MQQQREYLEQLLAQIKAYLKDQIKGEYGTFLENNPRVDFSQMMRQIMDSIGLYSNSGSSEFCDNIEVFEDDHALIDIIKAHEELDAAIVRGFRVQNGTSELVPDNIRQSKELLNKFEQSREEAEKYIVALKGVGTYLLVFTGMRHASLWLLCRCRSVFSCDY